MTEDSLTSGLPISMVGSTGANGDDVNTGVVGLDSKTGLGSITGSGAKTGSGVNVGS